LVVVAHDVPLVERKRQVSIQESLEILSVASLKKGLAATINQVSALKSLMSAWKNSNTLVFEV
jgi:hypothetical protein